MKPRKITYDPKDRSKNGKLLEGIERTLKITGGKFTRLRTSSTATYTTELGEVIKVVPRSNLSGYDVKFIVDCKKHFSGLKLPNRLSHDKPFYEYFRRISTYTEVENVYEVDLNAAYWVAAKELGYIDDKFFKKAFSGKVSKKGRLIGVGVLGKKTVTTEFSPPYNKPIEIISFDRNRVFWDNITHRVGEVMREAVAQYKSHVYGLWFDALFVDKSVVEPLRKFLDRRGYPVKSKKLESYIIEPREGLVDGAIIKRVYANGDTKKEAMYVRYSDIETGGKINSMEDFVNEVAKSMYL